VVLFVASLDETAKDRLVPGFRNPARVDGHIHVGAAYMGLRRIRDEEHGRPATDEDKCVAVLAQRQHDLEKHRARCCYLLCAIVLTGHHDGRITSRRIASPASSPRPDWFMTSRYA
jgi:hypothetical protein